MGVMVIHHLLPINFSNISSVENFNSIKEVEEKEKEDIDKILRSWRFRILQLCDLYFKQEYITSEQFAQLSEMYSLYKALHGNGPVDDACAQVKKLPIHH